MRCRAIRSRLDVRPRSCVALPLSDPLRWVPAHLCAFPTPCAEYLRSAASVALALAQVCNSRPLSSCTEPPTTPMFVSVQNVGIFMNQTLNYQARPAHSGLGTRGAVFSEFADQPSAASPTKRPGSLRPALDAARLRADRGLLHVRPRAHVPDAQAQEPVQRGGGFRHLRRRHGRLPVPPQRSGHQLRLRCAPAPRPAAPRAPGGGGGRPAFLARSVSPRPKQQTGQTRAPLPPSHPRPHRLPLSHASLPCCSQATRAATRRCPSSPPTAPSRPAPASASGLTSS